MEPPLLAVYMNRNGQPIDGENGYINALLDVSVQGEFGFDQNPSTISTISGTAAAGLDLTAATGALPPEDGGQHMPIAAFLNEIKGMLNQYGQPINYGSIASNYPRDNPKIETYIDTRAGMDYQFLPNNSPAGQSTAVTDPAGTTSGLGASSPTWGGGAMSLLSPPLPAVEIGRSFSQEEPIQYNLSTGHGPGSSSGS
jgi:hypothetical protein